VARIGAAIGRQFSYSLLSALVPNDPEGLTDALNRLTDSQLLDCTGVPPRCTYAFRHALIQDAAYSGLLLSERRELHRRIASALRQAEELSSRPEVLASHYTKAGEYRDAIPLWQEAAEQARRAAAH